MEQLGKYQFCLFFNLFFFLIFLGVAQFVTNIYLDDYELILQSTRELRKLLSMGLEKNIVFFL